MKMAQNQTGRVAAAKDAEETLQIIARLPAPEGLADRIQTRLRTAPRAARVLRWPLVFAPGGWGYGQAVRGAAAAAIVCVVAGGGWRIYSRVQPTTGANVVVMPAPGSMGRGFSTAGEVHRPDPGPAPLTHPALARPLEAKPRAQRPGEAPRAVKPGNPPSRKPAAR
ncbi:hypothetical protein DYQ86_11305 [Acidobacteria bacterium AB60]|nr:hypothetical protein DYQ86_11305 [Acidobacteria bacterium AB60]